MNDSTLVEQTVRELRDQYALLRKRTAPRFRHREEHELKWTVLAGQLIAAGLDARRYVCWAYDFHRVNRPDVFVPMITSPKTLAIYRDRVTEPKEEKLLEIRLQLDTLQTQLALGREAREIVEDRFLELGPVFRFALAQRAEMPDLVARFQNAAEFEMASEPLYRDVLSGFLK